MNVTSYNHKLENIEIPLFIKEEHVSFDVIKKCSKCNIIIATHYYDKLGHDDFFLFKWRRNF
jgi:hypothetical protein